jgi:hypothetical protein
MRIAALPASRTNNNFKKNNQLGNPLGRVAPLNRLPIFRTGSIDRLMV